MKKYNALPLLVLGITLFLFSSASFLVVGSTTRPSIEEFVTFPSGGTDNEIRGFASMVNGFALTDKNTTCTYNSMFPISGPVKSRGGTIHLRRDLTFDTNASLKMGTSFIGNNFALKFLSAGMPVIVPALRKEDDYILKVRTIDQKSVTDNTFQLDWSHDGNFCVVTTRKHNSRPELTIFSFDGESLTAARQVHFTKTLLNVVWHPRSHFLLGGGSRCIGFGNNTARGAFLYYFNPSTYSLHRLTGISLQNRLLFTAAAWHPSGTHFALIEQTNASKNSYLRVYSFTQTGSSGAVPIVEVSRVASAFLGQKTTVNPASLSWDATGNFVLVGQRDQSIGGWNGRSLGGRVKVFQFSSGALTLRHTESLPHYPNSIDVTTVNTAQLVTVPVATSSGEVRLYSLNSSTGILTEMDSARISSSGSVIDTHWCLSDGALLILHKKTSNSVHTVLLYSYNAKSSTLELLTSSNFSKRVNAASRGPLTYFAMVDTRGNISVHDIHKERFDFLLTQNCSLMSDADIHLQRVLYVQGDCYLTTQGNRLLLNSHGGILVGHNAHLMVDNTFIEGVGTNNVRCIDDTGVITLKNSGLVLSHNLTFSRGAFSFRRDVCITGTNTFTYATAMTSTVHQNSQLFFDRKITFSYEPRTKNKNLIELSNITSKVLLDGSSLHLTSTHLHLTKGVFVIANNARITGELKRKREYTGLILGDRTSLGDCLLHIVPGMRLDFLKSKLMWRNTRPTSLIMPTYESRLRFDPLSKLSVEEDMNIGRGLILLKGVTNMSQSNNSALEGSISFANT